MAVDLNNLSETQRLAEAESLSRRALRNFTGFYRRTGHEHRHFRSAKNVYDRVLAAMGLSKDEIDALARSAIEGNPEEPRAK